MHPSLLAVVAGVALSVPVIASAAGGDGGLVVEKVEPGRAGQRAGLRPGDVLVGWERTAGPSNPASGRLGIPADLVELEDTEVPLGPVTFRIVRDGHPIAVPTDAGELGLTTRPWLPPRALAAYERGRAAPRPRRAIAWRQAAREARREGASLAAFGLFLESARVFADVGQRAPALAALEAGQRLSGVDRTRRIQALETRGFLLQALAEPRPAAEALQQAVALRQEQGAEGLAVAAGLEASGVQAWKATDITAAEGFHAHALRIRETLAPESLVLARSLRFAASVLWAQSKLDDAEALLQRALGLTEQREPGGRVAAMTVLTFGNVALSRGNLREAAALYNRALDMRATVNPWSFEVCSARYNLGLIALHRADLQAADRLFNEACECLTVSGPMGPATIPMNTTRGDIAMERGDFAAARQFYERARVATQKAAGSAPFPLLGLGDVAFQEGDLVRAHGYLARALGQQETRYGVLSVWGADTLAKLGEVAVRRGRLAEAERFLARSIAIHEKTDPESIPMARSVRALGAAAEAAHDQERARMLYEKALATFERLAPGSYLEAEALHALGRLRQAQGASPEGALLLRRAVDVFENSAARIGGGQEGLSTFRARYREVYRDLMLAELEMGHVDEALQVVERSRGRVLLEWLARRGVGVPDDVTSEARREADDIDAEHGRIASRLRELNPQRDAAEVDRLVDRLRVLRRQRDLWEARLRERAPHYAALRYPVALDAAGVRAALDPGTVLLSYVVGPESTHLFVATGASPARVYTIPTGAESLRRRVTVFREGIRTAMPTRARRLRREARGLFDLLLGPAEDEIGAASRVLISADGPLHLLPFGALARKDQYVVEWRPLHFVSSLTVYAELRGARHAPADGSSSPLLAFADPRPGASFAGRFPRLPGSRREVRAIERQFPNTVAYLGAAASEGQARRTGGVLRVLHFATHTSIDEALPLDSALVLSPGPGAENGLLQAWEIFDGMRLDADLVTLSGCETALGREMGGEGLMGLTRAFLYAGARSVLASLWRVSDNSTAELMQRFYRQLARGASKDVALRAAQVEMIRAGGSRAHPFRWAAFQVFGDWH